MFGLFFEGMKLHFVGSGMETECEVIDERDQGEQ